MVTVGTPGVAMIPSCDVSCLLEMLSLHQAGVPKGGILSGQSAAMCP